MSKLDELLEQLCLNGVEYKTVSDIAIKYTDGMHNLPKNISTIGAYPILSAQNINNGVIDLNTTKYVAEDVFQKENKRTDVEKGDILLTIVGAIDRVAVVKDDLKALFQRSICIIKLDKSRVIPEYLGYVLESTNVQSYMQENAHGAAQKGIYLEQIGKIPFPVPPIEIQLEIVRILDNYTHIKDEIIKELTTELIARKKQYEYYRNKLLSYDNSIPKITFNDVAVSISSGKNKEKLDMGEFPVFGSTGIIAKTNTAVYNREQILVARVGANAGYVHIANGQYDVSDNTLIVDVKQEYLLKYVYYMLVNMNLNQYAKGGGQPLITAGDLKKLSIPMPNYEVQQRIVNVLDNFDSICTEFNICLPAEIEARQKQYEYYRDMLLTFVESGNIMISQP